MKIPKPLNETDVMIGRVGLSVDAIHSVCFKILVIYYNAHLSNTLIDGDFVLY